MALFGLFGRKQTDINEGVRECRETPGAVLLDVRSAGEYKSGYIEGAVSLPLQEIERAPGVIPEKKTKIFVYCLGGGRADTAAGRLSRMGYTDVKAIGGIRNYRGKVVR